MTGPRHFVSEPLRPISVPVSPVALAQGAPSLPEGFAWRGAEHRIADVLEQSKKTGREFSGEAYVRRHEYRLRMESGAIWTVYFVRHPSRSGIKSRKAARWYLLSIEDAADRGSA